MKNKRSVHSQKLVGVGVLVSALGQSHYTAQATGPSDYELSWFTIDGGGAMRITGGDYELSGTIGQPDAGTLANGEYELTGGFWFQTPPGDCDFDGLTNLAEFDIFEGCLAGPAEPLPLGCDCQDLTGDGQIDLKDYAVFQAAFNATD